MICHILFESEYSYRYSQLIYQNFEKQDHFFIVIGNAVWDKKKKLDYPNSLQVSRLKNSEAIKLLNQSEAIIIHGLFFDSVLDFFCSNQKYLSKTSWFVWGGDVYEYRDKKYFLELSALNLGGIKESIKKIGFNVINSLRYRHLPMTLTSREIKRLQIIPKLKNIIGVCHGDYLIVKQIYKTKAKPIYGFHPLLVDWEMINELRKEQCDIAKNKTLRILIGNSATDTNRHIEIFDQLKKFKDENIEIYCPLSYGESNYKQNVIESGNKLFSGKFHPLTTFLESDEYIRFLSSIDVAIMNHNRQQALGNIFTLLLLGKKIYLSEKISSFKFLKELGIKIYPIEDIIGYNKIDDLLKDTTNEQVDNYQIVFDNFSDQNWIRTWEDIFENKI